MGAEWPSQKYDAVVPARSFSTAQILRAWMPFAILSFFVLLWGLPSVKLAMNQATTPAFKVVLANGKVRPGPPGWDVPYLHNAISRAAPVVAKPAPEAARYDFNWQNRYDLAEPKPLPAGSQLRCTAVYDNSADNPANPDPTAEVRTGTQSWEEMFNGYFDADSHSRLHFTGRKLRQ